MANTRSKQEGGAGQHFVPASLLPYGGFGDPDTPAPYWKPARTVDPHKLALSQAQDRFMRRVRNYLREANIGDDVFEKRLGYRRYGLSRKLNGQELMTMRDLLKIAQEFPAALSELVPQASDSLALEEPPAKYQRPAKSGTAAFHEALQTAIDALDQAADHLIANGTSKNAELEPALRSLGTFINDLGRSVAGRSSKRNG